MNSTRAEFILRNLSIKEREDFLKEILEAKFAGKNITNIIISWEATAEINSSPCSGNKILSRSKKIRQFAFQSKNV
jgi:hypothetical protein